MPIVRSLLRSPQGRKLLVRALTDRRVRDALKNRRVRKAVLNKHTGRLFYRRLERRLARQR